MGLVRFAVRRPVTVAMLTIAVAIFGVVSFGRLPLSLLPDLSYPTLTLRTEYPDAAPAEVENLVTRPIEGAVGVLPGLRTIRSVSRAGASEVVLEFEWGRRMDLASLDVRERIERIRLPREVEPSRILRYDPSREPVMRLALWGTGDLGSLRRTAEDRVERRLETVSGVAAVELFGGVEEEIRIEADEGRLAAYGLTLEDLDQAVSRANVNLPGGNLRDRRTQFLLRTINELESVEEVEAAVVRAAPGGGIIRIGDVARVSMAPREREEILRVDGQEAVELAVYKEGDANLVGVAVSVDEAVDEIASGLPEELSLAVVSDRSRYIVDAIDAVKSAAIWGAILAIIVLVLFLRTFGRTLLVALAIPISVLSTFLAMDQTSISLNLMSLGGLALGIGMLVDNAIVVLESIERRREEVPGVEGVELGAGEVARAVTASTLTTVAVFGPVLFVVGIAGQLFEDLAATVCFALAASLIVSLALIPATSAALVRRRALGEEDFRYVRFREGTSRLGRLARRPLAWLRAGLGWAARHARSVVGRGLAGLWSLVNLLLAPARGVWDSFERLYPPVLEAAIRHRGLTLAAAVACLAGAALLIPLLGAELIPDIHQGEFSVQMRLDEGSSLATTSQLVAALERRMREHPDSERTLSRIGSFSSGRDLAESTGENLAEVSFVVAEPVTPEREDHLADEVRAALATFPDLTYTLRRPTTLSLDTPVEVDVFGDDLEAVAAHAESIAARLEELPTLTDVRSSVEPGHPEVLIRFDRDRLARLGLTAETASQALRHAVRGEVATQLRIGDDRIDVRIRSAGRITDRVEELTSLVVGQGEAGPIRLASVAEVVVERGPASIQRLEQQRVARITASPAGVDLGTALDQVRGALSDISVPPAVTVSLAGQSEEMGRSYRSLAFALALAVFLVYVVLASNFESLLQPFLILFAVPLAMVGVVPALLLTGHSLSILVLLGAVMLAGIVVNNAIVLVDTVNREKEKGGSWIEAVREAGRLRIRPIFMTTLTTVLGLFPMALGLGEGDELRAPMAVTVIGGLMVSTLLTLLVIPAAVLVFQRATPADEAAARGTPAGAPAARGAPA